jgi:hypothetical protein
MLGNTAFLVGCEAITVANRFDVICTVRNDAFLEGFERTSFWPGLTQLYIEFLALESGEGAVPMTNFGNFTFVHDIWNSSRLSYEAFMQPGGTFLAACTGNPRSISQSTKPTTRSSRCGCMQVLQARTA